MLEGRVKYTLEQLDDNKDKLTGTKANYISGIMDRLKALLDNEYVANCLLQTPSKENNFRKWADEGYFVGIRVPKDKLLDGETDLLVTYIVSKLWLSVLSRDNIHKDERKPCMLILDEPHQFPTVFKELYSIIREMRKWRHAVVSMRYKDKNICDMGHMIPPLPAKQKYNRININGVSKDTVYADIFKSIII
jgi:type IV secretory pathway TraG/TraD family ATPase VirD4